MKGIVFTEFVDRAMARAGADARGAAPHSNAGAHPRRDLIVLAV